jgi:uncharacterized protein YozE (UPF0346 family)
MRFKQWTKKFVKDETALGDLARDIHEDPTFPTTISKRQDLIDYLKNRGACYEAIAVANEAYSQFETQK